MYTPGNILYFTPFYFPDGGTASKNKYFIVLKAEGIKYIIASLPTSIDHIPENIMKKHGCINDDSINFNCYFFQKDTMITDNEWAFPLDTYVYGEQIALYDRKIFDDVYAIEQVDYEIKGKLTGTEFSALIECIKNSSTVKRKIRRMLGAEI